MHAIALLAALVTSGLTPARGWFAPDAAMNVAVKAEGDERLVLTRFDDPKELASKDVSGESTQDLKQVLPPVSKPGCYLLYLVPKGKPIAQFTGTPLVISVKEDGRPGVPPGPMVTRIEPLQYVLMTTNQGPLTMAFYYDVAPNTVHSFVSLAAEGYYDGLTFHRIVPGFVIQGGDPRGDGTGGPGYSVGAEFNKRTHQPGVLSMARGEDPNSAGSQFFVCLDYTGTQQLDGKYTTFGKVTSGMDAVTKIAAVPLGENSRPRQPQVILKAEVKPVTAAENPYATLLK